jgi:hypothetical protein
MGDSHNQHREIVLHAIRVYQLLGHAIEEIVPVDESRTDLKIRSDKGELWIARCDTGEDIDAESIRSFIVSCSLQGPQQLAILTTGVIATSARDYVEGHPIHLVDSQLLREFEVRAERRLIEKALKPVTLPDGVGVAPQQPPSPPVPEPRRAPCPYCGEENLPGALVCNSCNRNLVVTAPLSLDGKPLPADEASEPMFSSS